MATYPSHEWLIYANTIIESGGAANVVVTAVCQRCGEVRSAIAPTIGPGQIILTGECNTPEDGEPNVVLG
jgi:hypothetical protein